MPLPNGKTRIYLGDASGSGQGAQVYRIDDASQPAATLTANNNQAWTRLSNSTNGTPGFAVYNYCVSAFGGQCSYDMSIMSPPNRPDMVVVAGLMHYEELNPYEFQVAPVVGPRSNGRAVLVSFDAGATWNDATGDVGGESMHPDQHAIAFDPNDPDRFFVGSDGGLIRTSGQWADASSQCDEPRAHQINPAYLTECKQWLSKIPTELQVVNAGLGDLQMYSISVNPFKENDAMTGLAGQRHDHVHGHEDVGAAAHRRRMRQRIRRQRSALPLPHVHERADGHQLRRLQPEHLALDRRPLRRRLPGGGPLLHTDRLRSGADEDDLRRRAERLADIGWWRRPRVPGGALQRDDDPRQGSEQPAVHRCLWLCRRLAEARHGDADGNGLRDDEERQHHLGAVARHRRRHDVGGHRRGPRADLEEHQRRRPGERDVHPDRHVLVR